MRSTASTGTSPSNGQPNAQATAPRSGVLPRAMPASSSTSASAVAIGALRLAWLCVSLAETKHTISSTPAASARSAPRALGASAAMRIGAAAHAHQHLVRIGELRHARGL
jgi:hypothetical protein